MENNAESASRNSSPPEAQLMQMIQGMWAIQAVATAARLGIADALAKSPPQSTAALASAVGANTGALSRLLRALVSLGVVAEETPRHFSLTPTGELLRSDVPNSMRDWIVAETDHPHWRAWGDLVESVRTGEPAMPRLFGMTVYEYYGSHPEDLACFSRAMGNVAAMVAQGTVKHYDFSKVKQIVDVGGAEGDLLLAILAANPQARGIVLDRAPVIESTQKRIKARALEHRCEAIAGDFFEEVPAGGDLYILKFILVDWKDPDCLRILRNCRKAITPEGKLLIIEMTIPDDDRPSPARLFDLNMLLMTGGQERHQSEYRSLMGDAGFRFTRLIATGTWFNILEAEAA